MENIKNINFYRNSAITNFNNTLYNDPRLKTNTK